MKNKLCKVLVSVLVYMVFTTLFVMPFFICYAANRQQKTSPYPVFHPSYATMAEFIRY